MFYRWYFTLLPLILLLEIDCQTQPFRLLLLGPFLILNDNLSCWNIYAGTGAGLYSHTVSMTAHLVFLVHRATFSQEPLS
jgi:hypothetical protein